MNRLAIVCVEDDPGVRDALVRDLAPFASYFHVDATENAAQARSRIDELLRGRVQIALVLADHVLADGAGVDLLVELNGRPETAATRKVILAEAPVLQEAVRAVNDASLDHYLPRPWSAEALHAVVRRQLTEYIIHQSEDPIPYLNVLDTARLLEAIHTRGTGRVI